MQANIRGKRESKLRMCCVLSDDNLLLEINYNLTRTSIELSDLC